MAPGHAVGQPGPPITRRQLAAGLIALGVRPGGVLMVHTRMSALGWVVGGSGTVVQALLDALGPDGTVMAYAGWDHDSYDIETWPSDRRAAYEADPPAYDPATSEATRDNGRLPERIRTWPGARRSRQPEANIVALGPRAGWIVADHPWDDPYGAGSPLAKLVEADGQVLMLGAPLETITLLHHAEATARHRRSAASPTGCRCWKTARPSGGPSTTSTRQRGVPLRPDRLRRSPPFRAARTRLTPSRSSPDRAGGRHRHRRTGRCRPISPFPGQGSPRLRPALAGEITSATPVNPRERLLAPNIGRHHDRSCPRHSPSRRLRRGP